MARANRKPLKKYYPQNYVIVEGQRINVTTFYCKKAPNVMRGVQRIRPIQ